MQQAGRQAAGGRQLAVRQLVTSQSHFWFDRFRAEEEAEEAGEVEEEEAEAQTTNRRHEVPLKEGTWHGLEHGQGHGGSPLQK